MVLAIRKRLFEIINGTEADDRASRLANGGMLFLIFLNVVAVALETEEGVYSRYARAFDVFEAVSVAAFTAEYLLRLWTCTLDPRFRGRSGGRLRFAFTPMAVVDLIAFLPFYLPSVYVDLRFMRALRLFRVFRLLKLGRYSQSAKTLANVMRAKKEELAVTFFSLAVLLVLASSLMYTVEHEVQPELFSSIPSGMWAALTTVGYGDAYPETALGRVVGGFMAILGIGVFALPAGIIASGFAAELGKRPQVVFICPHCGVAVNLERQGPDEH